MSNPRFTGTYADYQEYVKTSLRVWQRESAYREDVVQAAWERGRDGISAALDCQEAEDQRNAAQQRGPVDGA